MISQFRDVRRVSTPLVRINTLDANATQLAIAQEYKEVPLASYDPINGLRGLNSLGSQSVKVALKDQDPSVSTSPVEALSMAARMSEGTILFAHSLEGFLAIQDATQVMIIAAIANLRDLWKGDRRTFVLLGPEFALPPKVANDFTVLDEPLPNDQELKTIIGDCHRQAKLALPGDKIVGKAVDALRGLAVFPAEQVTAMSLRKDGLDLSGLWERKRRMVENNKGLSIWRGAETFGKIFGMDNLVDYTRPLLEHVNVCLFMDEIEKSMAGAEGDTSGVSQALHRRLLTAMSDWEILALLLVGPPGTGKSMFAKAIGNEGGFPTISLDIDGVKGSLVGESEMNCNNAFNIIDAVGQRRILLVATCNDYESLSPELRSRFLDTFFVELPVKDARTGMWVQYGKEFGIKDEQIPADEGWTGREIKGCCRKAKLRKTSLQEAARFVVPISVSAKEKIDSLREKSDGRFLDAAKPGLYRHEGPKMTKPARAIALSTSN